MSEAAAVPVLRRSLHDRDPYVRLHVARSRAQLRHSVATRNIFFVTGRPDSACGCRAASLDQWPSPGTDWPGVRQHSCEAVHSPHRPFFVVRAANQALAQHRTPQSIVITAERPGGGPRPSRKGYQVIVANASNVFHRRHYGPSLRVVSAPMFASRRGRATPRGPGSRPISLGWTSHGTAEEGAPT